MPGLVWFGRHSMAQPIVATMSTYVHVLQVHWPFEDLSSFQEDIEENEETWVEHVKHAEQPW